MIPDITIPQIEEAVRLLREIIPPGRRLDLDSVRKDGKPQVFVFDFPTYEDGSKWLSSLGFQQRGKEPQTNGHCFLRVETTMLSIVCLCGSLPPTCRLVKKTIRVPKKSVQTIVSTHEFVDVETTEIVCDGGTPEEQKLALT